MRPKPLHPRVKCHRAVLPALLVAALLLLLQGQAAALPGPDVDRPDRWFDDHVYHHHADLTTELQDLAAQYSHYMTLDSIGASVRGRELWTVRITDPSVPAGNKTRIYLDGEHHGNEYLGGELCILLIHHLLEDQDDPLVQQLLRESVVWVTPMLNPDGNARDTRNNVNGIDLNRHYPFMFTPSGSHGDAPAVEPEVAGNVAFMEGADLDLYITMHTGIVVLIHPWGWTYDPSPDAAMFEALREVVEPHGVTYGQGSEVLYLVDGSSEDFAYGALGVPGFTFEVDGQQTNQISRREDIAGRLSDELALLMDMMVAAPPMKARLEEHGMVYRQDPSGGMDVTVHLHNPSMSPANNTTVTVEAYRGGSMVTKASAIVDAPAGNSTQVTVHVGLDDGTYLLRTLVEYPTLLVDNATVDRVVLGTREVTVEPSALAGMGAGSWGLLVLLAAAGAAVLVWANRSGRWRPGQVLGRVRSAVHIGARP